MCTCGIDIAMQQPKPAITSNICNAAGDSEIGCVGRLPGEPWVASRGAPRRSISTSGTMVAQNFVVDTEVVLAKGSGSISLDNESMNLLIDGETKKPRILRLWAPITVQGQIRSPKLGVKPTPLIAQGGIAAALGALINPIAALLPFVDPGLAEDADCGALIGQAGRQGAAVTTSTRRP